MDKFEYKVRADEIKELIAYGEYAQAAEIADTIDWRRVKSVMMLCTISDLYKINRRYEDAKNMLLLAYERRPGGRTICYSLCELCIKTEEFVQAVNYYKEFVQVAPKDTGRYILQYKLYEAQDVSLEERISVLEELKKRDYREKWAYELAYLYHRVGLATRCVEECDELILWFGEGKYVIKAMELKMLHQPLTAAQQERYDHRFDAYIPPTQNSDSEQSQDQYTDDDQVYEVQESEMTADYDAGVVQGDTIIYDNIHRAVQEQMPMQESVQVPVQEQPEELDIHVKTMDMGKYNTLNLQAELAAGLREVLGDEQSKSAAITRSIVAPMLDTETLDYPELEDEDISENDVDNGIEVIESTEVFFGETGEMGAFQNEAQPEKSFEEVRPEELFAASEEVIPEEELFAASEEAIPEEELFAASEEAIPEEELFATSEETIPEEELFAASEEAIPEELFAASEEAIPEEEPLREDEILQEESDEFLNGGKEFSEEEVIQADETFVTSEETIQEEEAEIPVAEEVYIESQPEPEPMIQDTTAAIVMNQLRMENIDTAENQVMIAQPPKELAGVLSQESDGQISLVMPEMETVEKQITGQMNIQDVLAEWEQLKQKSQERREEEVRQRVLQQTGSMFTEFEASVRDGLLEQLESGVVEDVPEEVEIDQEESAIPETQYDFLDGAAEFNKAAEYNQTDVEKVKELEVETNTSEDYGEVEELEEIQEEPEEESVEESVEEPEEEPAEELAVEPEQEPVEKPVVEPEQEPVEEPVGEPEQEPVEEPVVEPEQEPVEESVEEPEEEPAEELTVEPEQESAEEPEQEPVEEPVGEREETEQPAVEREMPKARALTQEEKELFAPYIQSKAAKEQLVNVIDNISMAAYTGNIIITGDEGMDTITLAKNLIREVQLTDSNFSGKVAKISGVTMNKQNVTETINELKNGALIIQKASGMNRETALALHRELQRESLGIIVVIEDSKRAINKLLSTNKELEACFSARMNVEALSNDMLAAFGRQYAKEMEYMIDDLGVLALHTRIEELQTIDHAVTVLDVKRIVDEAISHSNKKTLGHFVDILLAKRYDEEDMIILTEKDFV